MKRVALVGLVAGLASGALGVFLAFARSGDGGPAQSIDAPCDPFVSTVVSQVESAPLASFTSLRPTTPVIVVE